MDFFLDERKVVVKGKVNLTVYPDDGARTGRRRRRAMSVLRAEGLVKTYRSRTVVKGVDLEVRQGEIVGLLGPNGAGKTTTFYMIVGLAHPDRGRVLLDDERDLRRCRCTCARARGSTTCRRSRRSSASSPSPRTSSRSSRTCPTRRRSGSRSWSGCSRDLGVAHLAGPQGALALRGRAPPRRDLPRAGDLAALRAARRAVRRHRPDRGDGHPEARRDPQGARDRHPHHRPQRAGDPRDHGPRLHHQRGRDPRAGDPGADRGQREGPADLPRRALPARAAGGEG